jgi:hypothetical protein
LFPRRVHSSYPEIHLSQRHESQRQLCQFQLSRNSLVPVFIIFNSCACRWLLSVMPAGGSCQLCLPGALVSCACRGGSCQLCLPVASAGALVNCACRGLLSVMPTVGPCQELLPVLPAGGPCRKLFFIKLI